METAEPELRSQRHGPVPVWGSGDQALSPLSQPPGPPLWSRRERAQMEKTTGSIVTLKFQHVTGRYARISPPRSPSAPGSQGSQARGIASQATANLDGHHAVILVPIHPSIPAFIHNITYILVPGDPGAHPHSLAITTLSLPTPCRQDEATASRGPGVVIGSKLHQPGDFGSCSRRGGSPRPVHQYYIPRLRLYIRARIVRSVDWDD